VRVARPELLQWYGLFGAALAWTAQLVLGFGVSYADCSTVGSQWGLDVVTWEVVLMVVGGLFAVIAEVAAVSVFLSTRRIEYDDPPPDGRRHFFSFAAMLGNLLFINAILLSGIAAIANSTCRPV
jgi:hypothetical protein